jgi:hypothetical protein
MRQPPSRWPSLSRAAARAPVVRVGAAALFAALVLLIAAFAGATPRVIVISLDGATPPSLSIWARQ